MFSGLSVDGSNQGKVHKLSAYSPVAQICIGTWFISKAQPCILGFCSGRCIFLPIITVTLSFKKKNWLFNLFTFQMLSPFLASPPQTPIPSSPLPLRGCFPTYPLLPQYPSIPLCWGIEPSQNKGLPSHWCQIMRSFGTYAAGAMDHPCVVFGWWFSPWELQRAQLVDIVLLLGLQSPSAPSVPPQTLPLGSLG
jgi:hypothetical protein